MTEYAFVGAKRSSASIGWSFATQTLAADASRPFSNPIAAAYQSTIAAAFAEWASVSGLTFMQVPDAGSVPIRIGFGAFTQFGELGETDFRISHGVLGNDTLVRLLDPATSALAVAADGTYYYPAFQVTLLQVALHEIGHALGLDHTTDPATVMYPYAGVNNRDLTVGDIEGLDTLYPYFTVAAANPVQVESVSGQAETYTFTVTRHGDPSVPLTIAYAVTGAPYPGVTGSTAASAAEFVGGAYPSGRLTFSAGSSTATLSVAVVGASTAQPDEGFAITLSSLDASDSVTVRGQVNALILDGSGDAQVNGNSLNVFRFFDGETGGHFYSASQAERNALIQTRPDLIYEGPDLTAVARPSADAAAVPVYRFFNQANGEHFYSATAAERDMLLATRPDMTFEGTAFYEHSTAHAGDTAVYRFFDVADGTHFFTANPAERASLLVNRPDLHDEGIAFYAPSA